MLKEITHPGLHNQLNMVLKDLNIDKSSDCLDVGCGTGAWLNRLHDQGYKSLHGIDFNAQQFAFPQATFYERNIDERKWELPDRDFSLITAIEIIEHLLNIDFFFKNIKKYLAENGYCIITTPNVQAIENRLCFLLKNQLPAFHDTGDPTHVTPILIKTLDRILPRYNLEVVRQVTWPHAAYFRLAHFGNPLLLIIISKVLKYFFNNDYPGDTICMVLRKTASYH